METRIPIHNLYYLLCYAWDRLEERDLIDVGRDKPPKDVLNLLGQVLVRAVGHLIRRGFERGYCEREEEVVGIRGRLILASTLRRQLPLHGRTECVFDELEHDTAANRVIKATLTQLVCSSAIEDELRHSAAALRRSFRDVTDLRRVTPAELRRISIHRNNRHYGFTLNLCEQILGMMLPDASSSGGKFQDFARDHQVMARLFEKFVRNFYEHHSSRCSLRNVSAKRIDWDFGNQESASGIWPGMQSDIAIERLTAPPLIVDTKFYTDVLKTTAHGKLTLSSANLYQLFTYVQNVRAKPGWEQAEGLLLYAENGRPVEESHVVHGARIRVATLALDAPWQTIEERLTVLMRQ